MNILPEKDLLPITIYSQSYAARCMSPLALREAKQCINNAVNMDLRSGLKSEQIAWAILCASSDPKTGINAFLEGKEAIFKSE